MCAERFPRVGRDQAALRGVLGVHVVDFTSFLPKRETRRPRLEGQFGVELAIKATRPPQQCVCVDLDD